MRRYILTTPKDEHGQPKALFRRNFENNVRKSVDQLSGICSGIVCDGVVNEREAKFFADYARNVAPYEPVWPFTDILARVERIFADGNCQEDERLELKQVMEALCGHTQDAAPEETHSTALPFDSPFPEPILFPKHSFVITGRFAYGPRRKVFEAIEDRRGAAGDSMPTRDTSYLVIGSFASRDWVNTNFGRKIEYAVKLRDSRSGISIISEEHWRKFV